MSIIHTSSLPPSPTTQSQNTANLLSRLQQPYLAAKQRQSTAAGPVLYPQISSESSYHLDPNVSASKSAPASPSGRLGPYRLAPLSSISPIQIAGPEVGAPMGQAHERSTSLPVQGVDSLTQTSPPAGHAAGALRQGKQPRARNRLSNIRRSSISSVVGSGYGTEHLSEEGFDSDATVRPGRTKYHQSLSQPDLTSLVEGKSAKEGREGMCRKEVEGWVGGVGKGHYPFQSQQNIASSQQTRQQQTHDSKGQLERRRPSLARAKSGNDSAARRISLQDPLIPDDTIRSSHSRSHSSISALHKSPSPRSAPLSVPTMSPITHRSSLPPDLSPKSLYRQSYGLGTSVASPTGSGVMSSEGDDSSESGDSLTFVLKRAKSMPLGIEVRQRVPAAGNRRNSSSKSSVLGLSFESPSSAITNTTGSISGFETTPKILQQPLPTELERMIRRSSLLSLRMLAVFPAAWSICVLFQALLTGGLWVDVWPYGVDLSKEALERVVAGGVMMEGQWIEVDRVDMLLCIAWAMVTGYFCFCLTTGLTHRWLSYYSLPSTITRLASLQCLCWPATYLTLWVLGARSARPLLSWVVIGVTTGWSRTVQMWVTSNVVPSDLSPIVATTPLSFNASPNESTAIHHRRRGSKQASILLGPPPENLSGWEQFTWGRRWDWDAVAREVGWKVGLLLLITTAWMFWGIENGKWMKQ